jgi:large subunit ribosomal protein L10
MPNLEKKKQAVEKIRNKMQDAGVMILADYRGLNVSEVNQLRTELREAGIEYKVVKNTLTRIAAHELGLNDLDPHLEGPTAIAFSADDPARPAKILSNFAKAHKALELKAGVLEGKVIGLEGVKALADLPPREVLLARVLGGMQAPLYGLVTVLSGPMRSLVYTLDAVRAQKEA